MSRKKKNGTAQAAAAPEAAQASTPPEVMETADVAEVWKAIAEAGKAVEDTRTPVMPKSVITSSKGEPTAPKGDREPRKKKKNAWIYNAAIAVCAAVVLFAGYQIISGMLEYRQGEDFYEQLAGEYVFFPEPDNTQAATPTPVIIDIIDDAPPPDPDEPDEPNYVNNPAPDSWPAVDFAGLRGINGDFAAWLLCVGTNINYPVVYCEDNNYYLNRLYDHTRNAAGTLFIDMHNDREFNDRNTIIHGHNMRNRTMFWTLTQYRSQSFYNRHSEMRLVTSEGNYIIELFAGYVANPEADRDTWRINFRDDEHFIEWVATARARSSFTSYVMVEPHDRLVTLSTCSYEFNNARYVVIGKLVPVDENNNRIIPGEETPDDDADAWEEDPGEEPATPDGDSAETMAPEEPGESTPPEEPNETTPPEEPVETAPPEEPTEPEFPEETEPPEESGADGIIDENTE